MWLPDRAKLLKIRLHNQGEDPETVWAEDLGAAILHSAARYVRIGNIPILHAKPTYGDVIEVADRVRTYGRLDRRNGLPAILDALEEVPLVVSIDPQGNLRLGPDSKPVTIERFKDELVAAAGKSPELRLAISADKAAPFGQIVKVMDAAKEAHIRTVSAFTKEAAKP